MASGQEQLVLLLFTAIVTYLTRGQVKAGVLNSMESIATRSASLRAGMPNKELAEWLARNEQKMLANPELRVNEPAPLAKVEPEQVLEKHRSKPTVRPADKEITKIQSRRDYLNQKFGRTGDVIQDINIRGNKNTAVKFFESQGYKPEDYRAYLNGLDLTKPVTVETINKGKKVWQYSIQDWQGMWYSPTPNVTPSQLGINPLGQIYKTDIIIPKTLNVYQSTEKVKLLRSTSAPILDDWSVPSQPFPAAGGARQMTSGQKNLFQLISTDSP